MKNQQTRSLLFIGLMVICLANINVAQAQSTGWPQRVLITNDNGINDIRIVELARAFSKVADTYVLAAMEDMSGTGHYFTSLKRGTVTLERRDLGENIHAYAVDGFPADCVILGLTGVMRDNPPDLVISGINGGANLGSSWIGSGTIGAARFAAFAGVPAIAVSGVDDNDIDIVRDAAQWVVALTQTDIVRTMAAPQYLTVSIPDLPPSQIKGIKVTQRADLLEIPVFKKISGTIGDEREEWRLEDMQPREDYAPPADSDLALYDEGYIVVVPMQADEHDMTWMTALQENIEQFPGRPSE